MPINVYVQPAGLNLSAKYLNSEMYTYTAGTNVTPNGILFHTLRPLLVEGSLALSVSQASSSAGTYTSMVNNDGWFVFNDNAAIFDGGMDQAGANANGSITSRVEGSAGFQGVVGGVYLYIGLVAFSATTNTGTSGCTFTQGSTNLGGGIQPSNTLHDNASYVVDLVAPAPSLMSMQGFCADTSGHTFAYKSSAAPVADYTGEVCRIYALWLAITEFSTTTTTLPVPFTAYTNGTTITDTFLYGSTCLSALNFLNNPPVLRAAASLTTSIPTTTVTVVPINATSIDSYSGFNTTTHAYTVPVNGVYLVHSSICYANGSTNICMAGVQVNGSTTFLGPGYVGSTTNIAPQMTRLLDLHAGDTVTAVTYTTGASNTLGTHQASKLCIAWLGSLGVPSTQWTPPNTGFRWSAGTSGNTLVSQFQQHFGNDLSFLMQKPYLLTYQTTPQTGLSQNAFHTITMNTVQGPVHASAGDSYSGWTSGASNLYTAQVAGWYLVVAGYAQVGNGQTAPFTGLAVISQNPSGTTTQSYFQHICIPASTSQVMGAEAVGLFYLRAGDQIYPQYQMQDGSATFSTNASGNFVSNFGLIWVSSL